jgi:hypothetical protein
MKTWLRALWNLYAKWRGRSPADRLLLVEALALLGIARLLILIIPFKWLSITLGRHMKESNEEINAADLRHARKVGRAVCSAAHYTPWKSLCLPQAVATQWMLKTRHLSGTLYLGVAKDETNPEKLAAHAWLRCGTIILTGREGHRKFTVVGTFS